MSSLTLQRSDNTPNLDGASDLQPVVKTSRILELEKPVPAKVKKTKTTTKESLLY